MFHKIKRVFKDDISKEELNKKIEELQLESKDVVALVIAAFITFVPVIIGIAFIFYFIIYLLFM